MTKVLAVESDQEVLNFVQRTLETGGYEVVQAKSRMEALDVFINQRPDVVIIDRDFGSKSDGVGTAEDVLLLNHSARVIMHAQRGEISVNDEDIGAELFLTEPLTGKGIISSVDALSTLKSPSVLVKSW